MDYQVRMKPRPHMHLARMRHVCMAHIHATSPCEEVSSSCKPHTDLRPCNSPGRQPELSLIVNGGKPPSFDLQAHTIHAFVPKPIGVCHGLELAPGTVEVLAWPRSVESDLIWLGEYGNAVHEEDQWSDAGRLNVPQADCFTGQFAASDQ